MKFKNKIKLKKKKERKLKKIKNKNKKHSGLIKGRSNFCEAGRLNLIPGSGRSPGEGNSYPLQVFLGLPVGSE